MGLHHLLGLPNPILRAADQFLCHVGIPDLKLIFALREGFGAKLIEEEQRMQERRNEAKVGVGSLRLW